MKTTILTAAVLIALGFAAHAESVTSQAPKPAEASKSDKDKDKKDEKAAPKEEPKKEEAKKEDDSKKADSSSAESERKKISGFQTNDGETGDLEVGIVGGETVLKFTPDSCKTGKCTKFAVFSGNTQNLNDMKALRDALGGSPEDKKEDVVLTAAEKRREERKKERMRDTTTEKDVREEIADMLSTECGIDSEVTASKSSRNANFSTALSRTRFNGLELPDRAGDSNSSDQFKTDAECSANVLKDFMADHEQEDISDLQEKMKDLKTLERELRTQLRHENTEAGKKRLEKRIAGVQEEAKKAKEDYDSAKKTASAYDRATLNAAKRFVINPSVNDLASRGTFTADDFFLHDLAATTPNAFKSVRKAASQGLLDVYKLQAQSYLAFNDMASKTQNPQEKLQYQQAALFYQQASNNYNNMMNNRTFQSELAHSAAQAGLEPKSILEEIYGTYRSGSQEITSYLTNVAANGNKVTNQPLPQILMVQNADGTLTQVSVPAGTTITTSNGQQISIGGANARGTRQAVGAGQMNMNANSITSRIPQPNLNGMAGNQVMNQNGIVNNGMLNQQPMIQQQQFQPGFQQQYRPMNQTVQPNVVNVRGGRQ